MAENENLNKPISGKNLQDFKKNADGDYVTKSAMTVALGTKVDAVPGKGLSTNDYDDTSKAKVNGLADIKTIGTGLALDDVGNLTATGTGTKKPNVICSIQQPDSDIWIQVPWENVVITTEPLTDNIGDLVVEIYEDEEGA